MKVIVNCPDSTRIISIVVTGEKDSNIWVTQELQSIDEGNEITIHEPEEDQEHEVGEELVRCKDCIHYDEHNRWQCDRFGQSVNADDYCSYGEREE